MASCSDDYLPVGERPEWADVAPRALPLTPQPVVSIARDELLADLMDYFWAAVEAGELRWACARAGAAAGTGTCSMEPRPSWGAAPRPAGPPGGCLGGCLGALLPSGARP